MLAVLPRLRPRVPEAVLAVALLAITAPTVGGRPLLLGLAWLAAVTPRLVEIDLTEHRLPDAIVLPGYPIVLTAVVLDSWVRGQDALPVLLGGAAYGLILLLLHVTGGMGLGDVKLAPLLGALTAALSPGGMPLALVIAFLIGGIGATGVLIRGGSGARMPFGPSMLLGAWAALLLLA